jgi:nicotinamide-nucleotide amidase
MDKELTAAAALTLQAARHAGLTLVTVESCTGGMVSASLTAVPGSSDVVDRAFVTYTNDAKQQMVGVPSAILATHGAVSEPVARAMAEGALAVTKADLAVSITGIAGPGGATETKPVGLVHFACARRDHPTTVFHHVFSGDRGDIRHAATLQALAMLAAAART